MLEIRINVARHGDLAAIVDLIEKLAPMHEIGCERTHIVGYVEHPHTFTQDTPGHAMTVARLDAMTMIAADGLGLHPVPQGVKRDGVLIHARQDHHRG